MAEETKKRQLSRFSEDEKNTFRNVFGTNEDILKTLRKLFYQMPLNAVDLSYLSLIKGKELHKLLRKVFLPELDPTVPFQQEVDFYMNIPLKDMPPEIGINYLKAAKKWTDYTDQQLIILEKGNFQEEPKIKFKDFTVLSGKKDTNTYIDVLTRNSIINQTEGNLNMLFIFANQKPEETPEQTIKRLMQDSSK